jgi:hypothetical protein
MSIDFFSDPRYARLAGEGAPAYAIADPFPHAVIDDFLPADVAENAHAQFPGPEGFPWRRQANERSRKLSTEDVAVIPPALRSILDAFHSPAALAFVERLTGIDGLIPDPYLEGGGLHQIETGGFLQVHADFNLHDKLKLDRRLNLIVYLNKDWREEYGGHLELWDREMKRPVKKVLPVFNRCVVFSTLDWSFHGHPEKLSSPPGVCRKSLALYYYSSSRPEAERSGRHGTLYQTRPDVKEKQRLGGWIARKAVSGVLRVVGYGLALPGKLIEKAGKALQPPRL